jgi:diaminohydroxyphosphoribosylaminopyrimidine deaminase / 5-amino-6-(5-phosphoribosylamino)uracil reductase
VHRLRARHDCVLTGSGTVISDDPQLNVRLEGDGLKQPVRAVIDRRGRVPPTSKLFTASSPAGVIVFGRARPEGLPDGIRFEASGAEDWTPVTVLQRLAGEGIGSILLECGAGLATAFLREALVDRIEWFRAPLVIGGDGWPTLGALALSGLDAAPRFALHSVARLGGDLHETYLRS